MNDVTIIVNSCDSYEDTWYPLFKLIKKYWPDLKYPIVLNTESKSYSYEGINITVMNQISKKTAWSKRLKDVLKRVKTKYVLFFLDDFFIMDKVDQTKLDEVINWMNNDSKVGCFSFYPVKDELHKDEESSKYKGYSLRNKKGYYRFNCQAAIWDRKFLISCLRNYESPWDFELIGNRRSRRLKKDFYAVTDLKDAIFKYDYLNVGLVRGNWKLPETADFFKKEGIDIDFSIRNSREVKKIKTNPKLDKIKLYLKKIRSLV